MDPDEAADALYAISPDEFMARRTALVKQARSDGDKELAKQITALRKPTRSAWLVNLLARAEPDGIADLLQLGHELQQAQAAMDGDGLRRLSKDRRVRIDALAKRAIELGREQGYAPPDGAVQEVGQTLQAALGDPAVAEQLQAGRLTVVVAYGGFGPDDLSAALAASVPAKKAKADRKLKAVPDLPPDKDDEAEPSEEAKQAAQQARTEADQAKAAADEAETAAEDATTRADELAEQVETLRDQLKESEVAEREAREEARAARKHLTELRRAAAAAEQSARRAEETL